MRNVLMVLVLVIAGCEAGPVGLPAGEPCWLGSECASGFCVGFDCDKPGVCVDPELERACGPDAVTPGIFPACTCDDVEIEARPSCPAERIRHTGRCVRPEPGLEPDPL